MRWTRPRTAPDGRRARGLGTGSTWLDIDRGPSGRAEAGRRGRHQRRRLAGAFPVRVPGPNDAPSHAERAGDWLFLRITDPTRPPDPLAAEPYRSHGRVVAYASPFFRTVSTPPRRSDRTRGSCGAPRPEVRGLGGGQEVQDAPPRSPRGTRAGGSGPPSGGSPGGCRASPRGRRGRGWTGMIPSFSPHAIRVGMCAARYSRSGALTNCPEAPTTERRTRKNDSRVSVSVSEA